MLPIPALLPFSLRCRAKIRAGERISERRPPRCRAISFLRDIASWKPLSETGEPLLEATPAIRRKGRPMGKKIDKKQLDEPDKLQLIFLSARAFMERHKSRIYAGAGIFLFVLAMIGGWTLYRVNYEKSAGKIYSKIFETAQKAESQKAESPDADQAAIKEYKDLIVQYPRSRAAVLARYRLGNHYFSRHEFDAAILAYKDFLSESPAASD